MTTMGLQTAEALILDVRDLHDRDRIVTFLTREYGKKKGVAKGARVKHSRFGGQLQPLAKVQVTWFEREGRDLVRISSVELVNTAHLLQADLEGILLGSYLADHLLELAQEGEASDHLYRLLDSTLQDLAAGLDRDLATRYFEIWALRIAGVFPAPHVCPNCGRPFPPEGAMLPRSGETLLCLDCGGPSGFAVAPETLHFLLRTGRENLPTAAHPPPTPPVPRQGEAVWMPARPAFLQRELRSYDVIKTMLARL